MILPRLVKPTLSHENCKKMWKTNETIEKPMKIYRKTMKLAETNKNWKTNRSNKLKKKKILEKKNSWQRHTIGLTKSFDFSKIKSSKT